MNLPQKIESYLFYKGGPITITELARVFNIQEEEIHNALAELKQTLIGHGIVLIETGDTVALGTHPEASEFIRERIKDELSGPLTKPALETLAIICYRAPVTKPDIDYIRGVNSHFILRNLLMRGLVKKIPNPHDARSFFYRPTTDLIAHLGITGPHDLPEYESYRLRLIKETEHEDTREDK